MADIPRLIEHAFPLEQASLDTVHEKNVRHGHISISDCWFVRWLRAVCQALLIDIYLNGSRLEGF